MNLTYQATTILKVLNYPWCAEERAVYDACTSVERELLLYGPYLDAYYNLSSACQQAALGYYCCLAVDEYCPYGNYLETEYSINGDQVSSFYANFVNAVTSNIAIQCSSTPKTIVISSVQSSQCCNVSLFNCPEQAKGIFDCYNNLAITAPSTTGANTGSTSGANTGSNTGANTGANTGSNTGATTGATTGSNTGATTGPNTGATTGATIGSGNSIVLFFSYIIMMVVLC